MGNKIKKQQIIKISAFLLLFAMLALLPASDAHAATITVCASGCDHTTIQNAVNAASSGDTISLAGETFEEDGITITKNLIIQGQGAGSTIVQYADLINNGDVFTLNTAGTTVELRNMTIRHQSRDGSGIVITGTGVNLTVLNSTIRDNTSGSGSGGGIEFSVASTVIVENSLITNNISSTGDGGGIRLTSGTLYVNNSTISNNSATDDGGGIANNGTTTINNSLIANNLAGGETATRQGGGIYNGAGDTLNVNNSTISGNTANGSTGRTEGGGIFNTGYTKIYNSTMSGNEVLSSGIAQGGGIHNDNSSDTFAINNSIITNSTGGDCSNDGSTFTGGNNLADDFASPPCSTISTAAVTNFYTTLGNNGGPTQTHALSSGSNAVDNGTGNCLDSNSVALATDQRGGARPYNGTCDIGAYELRQTNSVCGVNGAGTFVLGNVAIQVVSETDVACLSVEEMNSDHLAAFASGLQSGDWWYIEAWSDVVGGTQAATYEVNLTLPDLGAAIPLVCKHPGNRGGDGWNCDSPSSMSGDTVTLNGISALSDWTVGDNVGPTAVSLQNFSTTATPSIGLIVTLLLASIGAATLFVLWRSKKA